ncbi:MAG TPA: hypothetical protein VFX89_19410 [Gammaproteobacteria bacterium]|nr:hypothetical protein [Gammaproteobacteria bacterium]
MSAPRTLQVSRQRAAARKRIRLSQLQARFRFKHRHAFDDFWGEQLLDIDIADTALLAHEDRLARAAPREARHA